MEKSAFTTPVLLGRAIVVAKSIASRQESCAPDPTAIAWLLLQHGLD